MKADQSSEPTVKKDAMTGSDAVFENVMEECTECGACLLECAFLRQYGNPKALAREFRASVESDPAFPFLCSLCGLCSAVCPQGLQPQTLFLAMRRILTARGGGIRPGHSSLLRYERIGISRLLTHYAFPPGCDSVFFPGCALPGTRPDKAFKVFAILQESIPSLGIVLDCCAKPSHDLGRHDRFLALFGEMKGYLLAHGITTVLTACPNCHRVFADYGSPLEVRSIYEVLDHFRLGGGELAGAVLSVHDSCVERYDEGVQNAVRSLIRRTGCSLEEMPHSGRMTLCCGEGGAVAGVSRGLASRWTGLRKAEAAGKKLVTCCAGCSARLGKTMPAAHILDYLFNPKAAFAGRVRVSRPPWTYWNRRWLKAVFSRMLRPATTRSRTAARILTK